MCILNFVRNISCVIIITYYRKDDAPPPFKILFVLVSKNNFLVLIIMVSVNERILYTRMYLNERNYVNCIIKVRFPPC